MPTSDTFTELVADSVHDQTPLGHGDLFSVYAFKDPAFANYAIRISNSICNLVESKQGLIDYLQGTTSLTPINYGLKKNFGQPVLFSENLQIVARVPGKSLHDIQQSYRQQLDGDNLSAEHILMKRLNTLPDEKLKRFLEDFKLLNDEKALVEPTLKNILLDNDGNLRWVDVVHRCGGSPRNTIEDIAKVFASLNPSDDQQKLIAKFIRFGDELGIPHHNPHTRESLIHKAYWPIGDNLAIEAAPSTFLQRLNQTSQKIGLSF